MPNQLELTEEQLAEAARVLKERRKKEAKTRRVYAFKEVSSRRYDLVACDVPMNRKTFEVRYGGQDIRLSDCDPKPEDAPSGCWGYYHNHPRRDVCFSTPELARADLANRQRNHVAWLRFKATDARQKAEEAEAAASAQEADLDAQLAAIASNYPVVEPEVRK